MSNQRESRSKPNKPQKSKQPIDENQSEKELISNEKRQNGKANSKINNKIKDRYINKNRNEKYEIILDSSELSTNDQK